MTFGFEKNTWLSASRLILTKGEIFRSEKESHCSKGGGVLTVGQLPINIGDTIIEVDTLAFTVTPVLFPQLRFEVVAVSQIDFLGAF